MTIDFYKLDGAGNDFVILDTRACRLRLTPEVIAAMCHRRRGIGADGLMMLCAPTDGGYDFTMHYYNADGYAADMCGNGGRCMALLAYLLGLGTEGRVSFVADDGPHEAQILHYDAESGQGLVRLTMRDVLRSGTRSLLNGTYLNTGVPHYVQQVDDLEHYDVVAEGCRLRHHAVFGSEGANIDFVQPMPDGTLHVRTYERGVEDETWACGTGVTACALVTGMNRIVTRGGSFEVDYQSDHDTYTHIRLTGPVSYNFKGTTRKLKVEIKN